MRVIYDPAVHHVPIKVWASDLDTGTQDQASNLAALPFAVRHVALMPDAHLGYGMPIGGVLAAKDYVVPNAVGVDIGCFTADTEVTLLDGTTARLDALAERSTAGQPISVYACRDERIYAATATARRTRRDAALVRVTLDNGQSVRCTPDHEFMLRDGTYRCAAQLAPGTSLMPLYMSTDREGYTRIQQPYSGRLQRAHWVAARSGLLGPVPSFGEQRTVIHHRDFNEANNAPANLLFMGNSDHSRYHRGLVERNTSRQSPEFEDRRKAALAAKAQTVEGHAYFAARGTPNIMRFMAEHPEAFAAAVAGNGERGKGYLLAYNRSERGRAKSSEIANRLYPCGLCDEQLRSGFGVHNHRRRVHQTNHQVVTVEPLTEREDVYCLTVPEYGNFALAAGVFVHNCGMHARRTNIEAGRLTDLATLADILGAISARVPVGNGPQGSLPEAAMLPAEVGGEYERLRTTPSTLMVAYERSMRQLGTLGGGNHFIEVQADADGFVWLMLHSGSRALGKAVCDYWNDVAGRLNARYHSVVQPSWQLAYLDTKTEEGQGYLGWMRLCMAWALENRRRMLDAAVESLFDAVRGVAPDDKYLITEAVDTHHNYAVLENHLGQNVYVHRKGAVRARAGEMVIIPGSMETGSYIARGKGCPEAFATAPHGAGRRLSRGAAKRERTSEDVVAALATLGIAISKPSLHDVAEEAGHAYKDVDQVMADSADLVEPVYRLRPLGVIKG